MKIALAQMNVKLGQPQKNVERLLEFIQEAKDRGCDIVVAPELCVGGYFLADEYNNESFCKELMSYNEVLRGASKGIVLIYGNIYFDSSNSFRNRDGRIQKFNAAYIFQNGECVKNIAGNIISCFPKSLLPCYRVFDDPRYFTSMPDFALALGYEIDEFYLPAKVKIKEKTHKIGLTLCEDLWTRDYKYKEQPLNPSKFFIQNGADLIINLSASPWTYDKNKARDNAVKFLYEDCKKSGLDFVPFYYVNCVGAQNTGKNIVTFDGGSTVYNCNGDVYDYIPDSYREELFTTENIKVICDSSDEKRKPKNKIREKYDAIICGLKHIKDMTGVEEPKWIVGASGGIDSSLVIALLVKAFGNDSVSIVNMPSQYNSKKTIAVFEHLALKLDLKNYVLPITDDIWNVYKNLDGLLDSVSDASKLNEENDQARVRGLILSGIAARIGSFFTCNGNKLEVALGYATLYGDTSGAICPLADLTKAEVFEMARFVNDEIYKKEIIPNSLLPDKLFRFGEDQIAPSAELKKKQIDPMKFGYHDALIEALMNYQIRSVEDIMGWYLEGTLVKNLGISIELMERWNIDDPRVFIDDLRWFSNLMRKNIFKRIQSPPIIVTSKTAFGNDRREVQFPAFDTKESKELEVQIMEMSMYKESLPRKLRKNCRI